MYLQFIRGCFPESFALGLKMNTLSFSLLFALIAVIQAADLRKYCKNADGVVQDGEKFVPGLKYPHLHCNKDFLTYSVTGNNHDNLIKGEKANCAIFGNVLLEINALADSEGKTDMNNIVTTVRNDWCSQEDF